MADESWMVKGPTPREDPDGDFFAPARWPRYGHPLRVIILGREVVAVPTHWRDGRSVACLSPAPCPGCGGNKKRRPQYHFAAWSIEEGLCVVLVLGSQAAARLLSIASERHQLRGLELVLHKLRMRNRAGTEIDFIARWGDEQKLRQSFPLEPQLRRLFGVEVLPRFNLDKGDGK